MREGFKGTVYATQATCDLVRIMLPDSAHIQESDAELMNRKGRRRGDEPIQPLYGVDDAMDALKQFAPVHYDQELRLSDNLRVFFRDAGHILGSAILEIYVKEGDKETKLVFSGDLGQPDQPLLRDPTIIHGADFVITESTYGDRLHQLYDKETALIEIVNETMDRGGNLIIPSFAVGRTQTLLYYFYRLHCEGRLDPDIPIIIDSPLAINATRVFLKNFRDFDEDSLKVFGKDGKVPDFAQVHLCETAAESRALNTSEGSAIIISASGMADAGRVLHHLKHNLWRPESTILFVGYQAEGCLGRRLIDGITRVRVLGEEIAVKAQIKSLDGFSAHADANQLMSWLGEFRDPPHPEGARHRVLHPVPRRSREDLGPRVGDYPVEHPGRLGREGDGGCPARLRFRLPPAAPPRHAVRRAPAEDDGAGHQGHEQGAQLHPQALHAVQYLMGDLMGGNFSSALRFGLRYDIIATVR